MRRTRTGKAPQDGFRFGRTQLQRGGVLDDFVVLLPNQLPIDGPRQDRFEVGVLCGIRTCRQTELLSGDRFESRQQVEAQDVAEGKGDFALPVWLSTYWRSISMSVQWRSTPSIMAATSDDEQRRNCE